MHLSATHSETIFKVLSVNFDNTISIMLRTIKGAIICYDIPTKTGTSKTLALLLPINLSITFLQRKNTFFTSFS